MITSNQITVLLEKYLDSENVAGRLVTIFENPSSDEFKELKDQSKTSSDKTLLRFIANFKTKKVYVWDAYLANHNDIRLALRFHQDIEITPFIINGFLEIVDSGVSMCSWEDFESYMVYGKKRSKTFNYYFNTIFSYDWKWLDQYAKCSEFIKSKEVEFRSWLKPKSKSK